MSERVLVFLSQPNVLEALKDDDVLDVLRDISTTSDFYTPILEFFMRPPNLTSLVLALLDEPTTPPCHERKEPTYEEYAIVYRAHWVLSVSSFSSPLLSSILSLQSSDDIIPYETICQRLVTYKSRDVCTLEALTRLLNSIMDQFSPESLLSFFPSSLQLPFLQTLLVLVHYEPLREVFLRVCHETPENPTTIECLTTQMLAQLSPEQTQWPASLVPPDLPDIQFSRMMYTCDLLTDLIHDHRQNSLGHGIIQHFYHNQMCMTSMMDAVLHDLKTLPTSLSNESYLLKVLNSLLQQVQCGCVGTIQFTTSLAAQPSSHQDSITRPSFEDQSPHVDLPQLWKHLMQRLPDFLNFLTIPTPCHFQMKHLQLVYLMLPLLNVSCTVVDTVLIQLSIMDHLLEWILRFPNAHILHGAISRLFIVVLEDAPFMFGKELPICRVAIDPLRLHLLRQGCLDRVIQVYDAFQPPPPALIDIAISLDQAITSALGHSTKSLSRSTCIQWHGFRKRILLPTQAKWEEPYQEPPRAKEEEKQIPIVPETPLAALYNEEERQVLATEGENGLIRVTS